MSSTATPVTVTLALAGLPPVCPHCCAPPPDGQWAIGVHGHLLQVICARCFTAIAAVVAVTAAPAPHYHDATGHEDSPCTCPSPGTYAPQWGDLRECSGCGDRVAYLSSRDLCYGCEAEAASVTA